MKPQVFENMIIPEPNSGCWIWLGSVDKDGYGRARFAFGCGEIKAHRLAFIKSKGEIPQGLSVCHRCDFPPCVNPDHLFLGTTAQNHADRDRKGRQAKGSRQGSAKLTETQIRAIREFTGPRKEGMAQFNISWPQYNKIRNRKSWQHVT